MTPDLAQILAAIEDGRPWDDAPVRLCHAKYDGRRVSFCVDMRRDPIQRSHRQGTFYEAADLAEIAKHVPAGGVVVDIGANVGNHTVFFAMFADAGRVIPIEPNPRAWRLLINNVLINHLQDQVDLSFLGRGLSNQSRGGYAMQDVVKNLGSAKMLAGEGDIEVARADELFAGIRPDFIKIDVEGMEIEVLEGAEGLLQTASPVFFVEVDDQNDDAFHAWRARHDYEVSWRFRRYRTNQNYLITPTSKPG